MVIVLNWPSLGRVVSPAVVNKVLAQDLMSEPGLGVDSDLKECLLVDASSLLEDLNDSVSYLDIVIVQVDENTLDCVVIETVGPVFW